MGVMAILFSLCRLLVVLVVVDFGEFRVDDVVLSSILGRVAFGLLLVHRFAKLHGSLRQRIALGLDRLGIVALQRFLQIADGILNGAALGFLDLRAVFGQGLLGRMHQPVGMVLGIHRLAALLVLGGVGFGVLDHLLDVGFGQTARGLDADLLLLAGRLVFRRNVDNAVGIDVERNLDLRHAAWRGRNPHQVELTENLVVGGHFALALEDAD